VAQSLSKTILNGTKQMPRSRAMKNKRWMKWVLKEAADMSKDKD
jgi:hypothetical protein